MPQQPDEEVLEDASCSDKVRMFGIVPRFREAYQASKDSAMLLEWGGNLFAFRYSHKD